MQGTMPDVTQYFPDYLPGAKEQLDEWAEVEVREKILRERYYRLKEGITIDIGTGWISPDYRAGPGKVWAGYLPDRGYF